MASRRMLLSLLGRRNVSSVLGQVNKKELSTVIAVNQTKYLLAALSNHKSHSHRTSQAHTPQGVALRNAVCSVTGANIHTSARRLQSESANVNNEELKQMLKEGQVQLFDVRQPEELEELGKVEGAVNIPLLHVKAAFEAPLDEFADAFGVEKPKPTDDNIVFYCKSGRRSFFAMSVAHELGYKNARHYPGGFTEWAEIEENS